VRSVTPVELLVLKRPDFDRLVRERFAIVGKLGGELERERLLGAMPLFADLSPDELRTLADRLTELELPAGQPVVRQGEPGDAFYLVARGQLAVQVEPGDESASGPAEPHQVTVLGPGEHFGELSLLSDQPRSASVVTLTHSRLFVLRKADFDRLLRSNAEASPGLELVASRRRLDLQRFARAQ
jgi:CRP-like cAMP-binding protein